jgi:hypothetical protein
MKMALEILRMKRQEMDKMKDWFKGAKALKVRQLLKVIDKAIEPLEELRNDLIKKYGIEKDGVISVEPGSDTFQQFIEEYQGAAAELFEFEPGLSVDEAEIEASEWTARDIDLLELVGIYKIE